MPNQGSEMAEPPKTVYFSTTCFSIRRFINICGACLSLTSGSVDLLYFIYAPFMQQKYYMMTGVFLAIRFFSVFAVGQYFYSKFVRNYKPGLSKGGVVDDDVAEEMDEKGKSTSKRQKQTND